MHDTITLTGYLGRDPEIREIPEKTETRPLPPTRLKFQHAGRLIDDRDDDLMEEPGEYDLTFRSREYAVLSLAVHRWRGSRRETSWHRVVVWNVDRLEHIGVRLARKGSKVTVTGRRSEFKTRDDRLIEQIELISLQILQLK